MPSNHTTLSKPSPQAAANSCAGRARTAVSQRDIEKGLAAGFFRYLTKPIKVNEVMETLDVVLNFAESQPHTSARTTDKG